MNIFRKSLTAKFLLLFITLSLVPLSLTAYVAYNISKRTIRQQMIRHLKSVAILKEQQIHEWIDHRKVDNELLAETPYIQDAAEQLLSLQRSESKHEDVHNKLKEFLDSSLRINYDIEEIFIMSRSGKVIISTNNMNRNKIKKHRKYFIEGIKGTFLQSVYYSPSLQKATMTVASPLYGNGDLLGVIVSRVNLERIYEIMKERSGLGETGDTYIVNKYNYFLTESRFEKEYPLRKGIYTWAVQEALDHKDGHGVYNNYMGEPVIGVFRWMDSDELAVIAEINLTEAYEQIFSLRDKVLLVGIFIALINALLIVVSVRRLTSPLKQVSRVARGIAMGEYDQTVDIKSHDEVGVLAETFNKMTVELKKHIREIEESRDRTKKSLKEKVALLAEIHHRVKNNMAVISAILNLQAQQTQDDTDKKMFLDTRGRIGAMARVHNNLYQSDNFTNINFDKYLTEMVNELTASDSDISTEFDLEEVSIGIDTALPLGMIVNEIISNALNHAFIDKKGGMLEVSFKRNAMGETVLGIRDNGVGMPESVDIEHPKTLGMRFLASLVSQVQGRMEVYRDNGTEIRITFRPTVYNNRLKDVEPVI